MNMNISSVLAKTAKFVFANPSKKGTNISANAAFALGVGYSAVSEYQALSDIKKGKTLECNKHLMNSLVGMSATVGSIFGIGGAILAGAGTKMLCNCVKDYIV